MIPIFLKTWQPWWPLPCLTSCQNLMKTRAASATIKYLVESPSLVPICQWWHIYICIPSWLAVRACPYTSTLDTPGFLKCTAWVGKLPPPRLNMSPPRVLQLMKPALQQNDANINNTLEYNKNILTTNALKSKKQETEEHKQRLSMIPSMKHKQLWWMMAL